MNPTLSGIFALGLWSVFGVLFLYVRALPPFEILAIVFYLGYLAFTALQYTRGENISSYWRQPLSHYLFWLCGPGLYTGLLYIAFMKAPVFEANILNYLWPLLLVLFSAVIYRERLTVVRMAGMFCGFAGAFAIILPPQNQPAFTNFGWGHELALFCAVLWALYSTLTRRLHYPQGFQGPVFFVFATLCLLIHLLFEKSVMPGQTQLAALLIMGFSRVSYAFWDYGMKKGNVVLLASLSYFLPFLSSLFLIAFGERPAHPQIAMGASLIIAGCVIVNFRQLKKLFFHARVKT